MARNRTSRSQEPPKEFRLPDGMPLTLTMLETSRILKCGINGCYEAARRGDIPTIRIGRRLVVPTARLMSMLGHQPVAREAGDIDE